MAVDIIANLVFFVLGIFGIGVTSFVTSSDLLLIISSLAILFSLINIAKNYLCSRSLKV